MSNQDGEPDAPEAGEVRIAEGRVEVFDGERWGPYRPLPEPGGGPVFRDPASPPTPAADRTSAAE